LENAPRQASFTASLNVYTQQHHLTTIVWVTDEKEKRLAVFYRVSNNNKDENKK
jgi:hypothetical protein